MPPGSGTRAAHHAALSFFSTQQTKAAPLHTALRRCWGGLLGVAVFSAAANVLLLATPVYMLQIYDRVLPSASHATLIALTGVAVFLLSCFGLLDWIRQRLMTRVALTLHGGPSMRCWRAATTRACGGRDRAADNRYATVI